MRTWVEVYQYFPAVLCGSGVQKPAADATAVPKTKADRQTAARLRTRRTYLLDLIEVVRSPFETWSDTRMHARHALKGHQSTDAPRPQDVKQHEAIAREEKLSWVATPCQVPRTVYHVDNVWFVPHITWVSLHLETGESGTSSEAIFVATSEQQSDRVGDRTAEVLAVQDWSAGCPSLYPRVLPKGYSDRPASEHLSRSHAGVARRFG